MFKDVPLLILAVAVCSYWGTVVLLAFNQRLRHGRSAGILPQHPFERRLWILIVPLVAAWVLLPLLTGGGSFPWLGLPAWAHDLPWAYALRCVAAALAASCYFLSVYCWLHMGRQWSMAIVPEQTSRLVTGGLYRWARHPIYGLQVGLMLASAIALPTVLMALLACLHWAAMNLKARHEEHHLVESFGSAYREYCQRVGRFWPRWHSRGAI